MVTYLPAQPHRHDPARTDTPLPRGSRIPALRETVYVHIFDRETFDMGREEFSIDEQAF